MSDALEELLAARLHALGETVADEVPPPADLELQVARRRRHTRATRRWSAVGIAAAIVAVVAGVGVVHGTSGTGTVRVAASSTTVPPVHDSLQPGTLMLSARGRYVISLDENGHTNATMVKTEHGDVKFARATNDHSELWYLSVKEAHACGDVVRADIDGRTSTIVAHATTFDVSPDGARLALYGAGDLAHNRCSPVAKGAEGRVVVLDLTNGSSSSLAMNSVTSLRWSPDGSYLAAVTCPARSCEVVRTNALPEKLGGSLEIAATKPSDLVAGKVRSASIAFGDDALYMLEALAPASSASSAESRVVRVDPREQENRHVVVEYGSSDWDITQVIPTGIATYVVAAPATSSSFGLYRIRVGRPSTLVLVRPHDSPGTFTPVPPLPARG
jgi:hypothetical protein